MFSNYLRIARRYLLRHKAYTAINVLGLAVGITCCVLIMLFVRSEFSYDKFNKKADRIFRVWQREKEQGQENINTVTPIPAGPAIAAAFPSVEATCRVFQFNTLVKVGNTSFDESITMVDSTLFRLFDFRLLQGNPENPFPTNSSVILTPEMAKKYFGDANPIGKTFEIQVGNMPQLFTVAGIARRAPEESSIKYDLLISYNNDRQVFNPRMLTNWFNIFTETYVLLRPTATAAQLEKGLPAMLRQQLGKNYGREEFDMHLQPLTAIHLDNSLPTANQPVSNPKYSYILATIGILILLVACINFITLSVGRSATRAIEVGVRKALGAERKQLIFQFWGEALFLTLIAVVIGLVAAVVLLQPFNRLIDRHLAFYFDPLFFLFFLSLILVIALVAGIYPSVILSGFRPVEVLKGKLLLRDNAGLFRKGLIVGQFLASVVMLICTMVIGKQMDYLQKKDLGYDKEQVLIVPTNKSRQDGYPLASRYMTELGKYPQVVGASVSAFSFAETPWVGFSFPDTKKQLRTFQYNEIDSRFIEAMRIRVLEGRSFSQGGPADTNNSILVNETLLKEYGIKDPIGRRFGDYSQRIVGVVKDFNYQPLQSVIQPLVLSLKMDTIARQSTDMNVASSLRPRISVRMRAGNMQDNIDILRKAWLAVAPGQEFEYHFLDDRLAIAYTQEQKSAVVVRIASALSIFIACMGLFGLATLTVSRRTKEVGIRKVLGASTFQLVQLLSKEFLLLVAIASVTAVPIAAWAMHSWLSGFAYRTGLSWYIFAMAGVAAMAIALLTISFHTVRAAWANPADSLRTE